MRNTELRPGCGGCGFDRVEEIGADSRYAGDDGRFVGWVWCPNCERRSPKAVTALSVDRDAVNRGEADYNEEG